MVWGRLWYKAATSAGGVKRMYKENERTEAGAGGRAESSIICASLTEKTETIISKCLTKSPLRFTVSSDERLLAFAPSEGGLYVFRLGEIGRISTLSEKVMTAFFWSPDSRYLLWCYLDIAMRCFYWGMYICFLGRSHLDP